MADDKYLEEKFSNITKAITDLTESSHRNFKELFGILRGKNANPGLIDEVRLNTEHRVESKSHQTWLVKTIAAAVIVQLIAFAFLIVRGYI